MAAAEARAAWQRAANRCFVQEDAKRAPKLACCPSSSAQQYDSSNNNATNGQDHPVPNFMPLNWNPMNSNLPPDTKWWLQLQPNFAHQKDFVCEQLNILEDELEETKVESKVPTTALHPETVLGGPMAVDHRKGDCPSESPWMVSTRVEGMKTFSNSSQKPLKRKVDLGDYFFPDEEFMDWKPVDRLISKKMENTNPDLGTPWLRSNKCEPWWRIADKDELASLVAQKSQEHIENCDLPRPRQRLHVSTNPFACLENLDGNRIFPSSVGYKPHTSICDPVDYGQCRSTSGSVDAEYWSSREVGHLLCDSEKNYSDARTSYTTIAEDLPESRLTPLTPENDASRAQLLEALRHSQTRARNAEMAAQKAYDEKEHIVKILFRQASHLFAYKQWLHMLQLESLCLQLRIKDHQLSTLFPVLPWMPLRENLKRKGRKKKCSLCKYVVAFAVGLGLVGAGLLLGWTLGWLLPSV